MSKPFKGVINVDIRDSVPDWAPFEPPKAPEGAPSVVYIVLDDVGFSAIGCYGGPVETPNIDRIAAQRGALHAVAHDGAVLADAVVPADGPQSHAQQHGVHHRGGDRVPERERHDPAGERDAARDPRRAGLEHVHDRASGTCARPMRCTWPRRGATGRPAAGSSASTGSSAPRPTSGIRIWSTTTIPVDQPSQPEDGYHLTVDLTDRALEFIQDAKAVAPDKPFCLYYAPGACHAPHHVPKEWIEKYKGRFDMGYEAMREQTLERQKKLGHRPGGHGASADQPDRDPAGPQGPEGPAVPAARLHAPVGFAVR